MSDEMDLSISEKANLDDMAGWVVEMCERRGWSMHWTHRGAYLHLESSELIEAIRGKHGDPESEAGDVLLVLMSITEYAGIPFSAVVSAALKKLKKLEEEPPYPGEDHTRPNFCQNCEAPLSNKPLDRFVLNGKHFCSEGCSDSLY